MDILTKAKIYSSFCSLTRAKSNLALITGANIPEIDTIVVIIPISEVVYNLVIIIEPINPIICPNIDPEVNKRIDFK